MLKIAVKTKLSPEEVIKRAVKFFGTGGLGLELRQQNPECAYFEGGGGGVNVTTLCRREKNLRRAGVPGMGLPG